MRVRCLTDKWNDVKDPEITKGRFYAVTDSDIPVMNNESMIRIIGDNRREVDRPKHLFIVLPDMSEIRIRYRRVKGKIQFLAAGTIKHRKAEKCITNNIPKTKL